MDSREMPTDTRGSRNSPMEAQLKPAVQKFHLGMLARLIPRKEKSITNSLEPASPSRAWRAARLSGLIMDARYIWL